MKSAVMCILVLGPLPVTIVTLYCNTAWIGSRFLYDFEMTLKESDMHNKEGVRLWSGFSGSFIHLNNLEFKNTKKKRVWSTIFRTVFILVIQYVSISSPADLFNLVITFNTM